MRGRAACATPARAAIGTAVRRQRTRPCPSLRRFRHEFTDRFAIGLHGRSAPARASPSSLRFRLPLRPNDGAGTTKFAPSFPGLIDRYLARSIAVPLIGSLVLAAMLLVLDKMLRLFQYVVDAGGPVSVVWRMLANLLPEYLSLGIPIGLMLGILLAFRKLALSSELDALRGIGIGYGRLLRVPFFTRSRSRA